MPKMDIQINQAQLKRIALVFVKDNAPPTVIAYLSLMAGEKEVTEFQLSTGGFCGYEKMEIPLDVMEPIAKLATAIETIAATACQAAMNLLPLPPQDGNGDGAV